MVEKYFNCKRKIFYKVLQLVKVREWLTVSHLVAVVKKLR